MTDSPGDEPERDEDAEPEDMAGAEQRGGTVPQADDTPAVLVSRSVVETIWHHAESDTAREVGGILIGRVSRGAGGTLVEIETALPAHHAEAGSAHVTFTHDSWSEWYELLDRQFPGRQIVGWYHSHPNFGIFLSEHDQFIHSNFFTQPWQIAIVVDPVRRDMGCFGWERGRVVRLAGDRVYQALERRPSREEAPATAGLPPAEERSEGTAGHSFAERLWWLGWGVALAVFLVLFLQTYGMGRLQRLENVERGLAELRASVDMLGAKIVGMERPMGRWYIVQAEEDLAQICTSEYGDESLAEVVSRLNGLEGAEVKEGQQVWLPAAEAVRPPSGAPAPAGARRPADIEEPGAAASRSEEPTQAEPTAGGGEQAPQEAAEAAEDRAGP